MTIQEFSQALKDGESTQHQAFAQLRQLKVREIFDSPDGDTVGWENWG